MCDTACLQGEQAQAFLTKNGSLGSFRLSAAGKSWTTSIHTLLRPALLKQDRACSLSPLHASPPAGHRISYWPPKRKAWPLLVLLLVYVTALLHRHSASSTFGPPSQLAYSGAVVFFRRPSTAAIFSLSWTRSLVLSGYYPTHPRVGSPPTGALWLYTVWFVSCSFTTEVHLLSLTEFAWKPFRTFHVRKWCIKVWRLLPCCLQGFTT